jgi:hypothetical protein
MGRVTVLVDPVEYFRVYVVESWPLVPILSLFVFFFGSTSLTRVSASQPCTESREPYISLVTTKGYKNQK